MLRKAMFLTVALMMALTVNASAQCQFGVYADAEGTQTSVVAQRNLGQAIFPLDVYYVMYVEDFVLGAAWNREVTGGPFTLVGAQQIYDPNSQFLEVTPNGFRMGLGDCQIGFGGNAVFVLHEILFLEDSFQNTPDETIIQVLPNALEAIGPFEGQVVYSDCSQEATKHGCEGLGSLTITGIVAAPSASFGAVKALFK